MQDDSGIQARDGKEKVNVAAVGHRRVAAVAPERLDRVAGLEGDRELPCSAVEGVKGTGRAEASLDTIPGVFMALPGVSMARRSFLAGDVSDCRVAVESLADFGQSTRWQGVIGIEGQYMAAAGSRQGQSPGRRLAC